MVVPPSSPPREFFTQALADDHLQEFESQHVSRTLLSILVNLNNAVVWTVSTCPLISRFSCPFTKPLGIISECANYIVFSSLARSRYLSLFSHLLLFCGPPAGSHLLFILSLGLIVCLYIKIPENFMRLILQEEFWVVHIPLVLMVKFRFLL